MNGEPSKRRCACGKPKSVRAAICQACYCEKVKVKPVPVQYRVDPVRDALEWMILQSRGTIS